MRALFTVALLALLAACTTALRGSDVLPLTEAVAVRHDAYVNADGAAALSDRMAWLAESERLLATLRAQEVVPVLAVRPLLDRVCARHDAYVAADVSLEAQVKGASWVRSSEIVGRMGGRRRGAGE